MGPCLDKLAVLHGRVPSDQACLQTAKTPEQAKTLASIQKMAMKCFKAALDKQPGNVPAAVGTAAVQATRGDLALAARILSSVCTHVPVAAADICFCQASVVLLPLHMEDP